jgi:hypothetical protein
VPELADDDMRAGDQHFRRVLQGLAQRFVKRLLTALVVAVAVALMRLDARGMHLMGIEVQDLGVVVIEVDDGVEHAFLR